MGDILGGSLRTDSSGRTTLTGAGSDIDFGETIDKIIEAKRQPAVKLENRIEANQVKVDAMGELQSLIVKLEEAADALRGKPTFDNSGDVFEEKEGFLTATRDDTQTPSIATSILTANVENAAEVGSHSLEILRTAQGQQVASNSFASSTDALTFTGGGGDFTVNGKTISVVDGDSLLDVRDKINAANTGDNPTGVNAQVVSVSDTQKILTLSAETPGESIGLDELTNSPLQDLGILNGSEQIANELSAAQGSIFRVNGLSDGSVVESNATIAEADTGNALDTLGLGIFSDGAGTNDNELNIAIDNGVRTLNRTIQFDADNESLEDVAQRISDEVFGVSARVVTADGEATLEINAERTGDLQRSDTVDNATSALDTFDGITSDASAQIRLTDHGDGTGAPQTATITFDTTTGSLTDLRDDINATGFATASLETVNGEERLNIVSNSGGKLTVTDVAGSLAEELGIDAVDDVPSVTVTDDTGTLANSNLAASLNIQTAEAVSRKTNTIDNLFEGTTLNLFKAERGTNVQFDIERDQDAVNTAIQDFVAAYNDVKQFINAQQQGIALEGQDPDAEDTIVGALANESVLRKVEQDLNSVLSSGAENVSTDFQVLAQAGIDFVDNDELSDPTLENTLEIDQDKLNDALLNDIDDLRGLFQFRFSSDSSQVTLVDFTSSTSATDASIEVTTDANGDVTNVSVDGVALDPAQNEVSFNGDRFTIETGDLDGLTLRYDGGGSVTDTFDVSTSTGIGSEAFFTADKLGNSKANDGIIQREIDTLIGRDEANITGQNERFQEQIDRIDRQLERERERLLRQFVAMEQALIELESAQQRLDIFANGGSSDD